MSQIVFVNILGATYVAQLIRVLAQHIGSPESPSTSLHKTRYDGVHTSVIPGLRIQGQAGQKF